MTGIERHWIEVEWEEKRAAHDAKLAYLDRARRRYQAWLALKPKDAELFEQGQHYPPQYGYGLAQSSAAQMQNYSGLLGNGLLGGLGAFGAALGSLK